MDLDKNSFGGFSTAAFVVATISLALGGCSTVSGPSISPEREYVAVHRSSFPIGIAETMAAKGLSETAPILLRIFKEEAELEVWKMGQDDRYRFLKRYPICTFSGALGPKKREGDRQAPEGFYAVTKGQLNPNSLYKLSFNIGFPNAFDQANSRNGKHLMVHGGCSSVGCYAMGDDQITEIYSLAQAALDGGQRAFQVQALPFRMNDKNMLRHASNPNMPFWRSLKKGSDIFEETGREPIVSVVGKHYAFD